MTAPATPAAPPEPDPGAARPRSFPHQPALDGLRGAAVAAVLAYHLQIGWAAGGYLGVSAFFTLSGFLITSLLLVEDAVTGRVDLRAFWARRARRLLPAAIAGVGLGVAYILAVGDGPALDRVRGDALAALAYVANWRFVLEDRSYAELFAGDSPLQHLWSLAIEEQFYVLLPLVVVVARRRGDVTTRLLVAVGIGIAASVAASIAVGGGDRAYYGTDTRAAELLVGVGLAALLHRLDTARRRTGRRRRGPSRAVDALGVLALVGLVAAWATVPQDHGWLHPWLLLAHAAVLVPVLVAAAGDGPVAATLGVAPLRALGRISYGVYLYHWPLLLWIDEERTGLDGTVLVVAQLAATLAVAVVSHRLLEEPIRRGRVGLATSGPLIPVGAMALAALVVVAATAIPDRRPTIDFDAAQDALDRAAAATTTSTVPTDTVPGTPPATTPPRVAVFGDSTALLFVPGLIAWSTATGQLELVDGFAGVGCNLGRGGRRDFDGALMPIGPECEFTRAWSEVLARSDPDVALVEIGTWDIVDREVPGISGVVTIGDPAYDRYLAAEARAATDLLATTADRVVWVLQPPPVASTRPADDPVFERTAALNRLLLDALGDDPRVAFVDLAGWMEAEGSTDSLRLRPDGVHFTELTSVDLATWLGPALLQAAADGGTIGPSDVERVPARP